MTDYLYIVTTCAKQILGSGKKALDPDASLEDLGFDALDCEALWEQAAQSAHVTVSSITPSLPVHQASRGTYVMSSLQNMAAFSPAAAKALDTHCGQMDVLSLRSVARSLEHGKYLKSDHPTQPTHTAHTKLAVLFKCAAVIASCLVWVILTHRSCDFFADIGLCSSTDYYEVARKSVIFSALILVVFMLPGLAELIDQHRQDRRKET